MLRLSLIIFAMAASLALSRPAAWGADVPPHLVGLVRTLTDQIDNDDYAASKDGTLAQRTSDILRRARLQSWAGAPARAALDVHKLMEALGFDPARADHVAILKRLLAARGAAAQDEILLSVLILTPQTRSLSALAQSFRTALAEQLAPLEKRARIDVGPDQRIEIEWDPATASVLARVALGNGEGQVILHGGSTGSLVNGEVHYDVEADEAPVSRITPEKQREIDANVFGAWQASDGARWTITGGAEIEAEARARPDPVSAAAGRLDAARKELSDLQAQRVYVWTDPQGGEVIQKKFKKLPSPYRYDRERSENLHKAEIAALRERIAAAEAELKPPPVQQHDPLRLKNSDDGAGRAVRIEVLEAGGRSYEYDVAAFDGRRLTGSRTLRDRRDITDLPDWVISGLIASWSPPEWIEMEARYNPRTGATSLEGLVWRLKTTYDPNFNQIESIHTPWSAPLNLWRSSEDTTYRIVKLDINRKGSEQKRLLLESKVAVAQGDVNAAQEQVRTLSDEYDAHRARTRRAHQATVEMERQYAAALQAVDSFSVAENAKPLAYQRLERRRDSLVRQMDRIYEYVTSAEGRGVSPSAFESYDQMERELEKINARIQDMDRTLGFADERQRLLQATRDAFDAKSRADVELLGAVAVQDLAHARNDDAEMRLVQAQAKLDAAQRALSDFDQGTFLIAGIEAEEGATMRYKVEAWDPSEVLVFLDREIDQLGMVLQRASRVRKETRAEFLRAQEEASFAQHLLADSIMKSAVAQGLTELAFNAADVIEKTAKAGPVGALAEGAKKVVEAAFLGAPSFYEPTITQQYMTGEGGPFSDIFENVRDVGKYTAKRAVKSAVTSPAAAVIVAKYIAARDTRVYMELINQAIEGSMETGYRIVGATEAGRAVAAEAAMRNARQKLQAAVQEGVFRNFAGLTQKSFKAAFLSAWRSPQGNSLKKSVGRDLMKMALKKALSEWLEGAQLANYLAMEAEARLRTQVFRAASATYWHSYDLYTQRADERRELLRQYDARNHMAILTNESFREGADLLLVLRDADGKPINPAGHSVAVKLGGKPAQRLAGNELFFRIAAEGLAHDGKGGLALEIALDD